MIVAVVAGVLAVAWLAWEVRGVRRGAPVEPASEEAPVSEGRPVGTARSRLRARARARRR